MKGKVRRRNKGKYKGGMGRKRGERYREKEKWKEKGVSTLGKCWKEEMDGV